MDYKNEMISRYFHWSEALWLPSWNRLATTEDGLTDEIQANLIKTFTKLDIVREYFDSPIIVHCAYRPPAYNALVKGAPKSCHILGMAVDFHVKDIGIEDARKRILDNKMLDVWDMRMELGTQGWLHLDCKPLTNPYQNRAFLP